jgi:hypothetical protein
LVDKECSVGDVVDQDCVVGIPVQAQRDPVDIRVTWVVGSVGVVFDVDDSVGVGVELLLLLINTLKFVVVFPGNAMPPFWNG